MMNSDELECVNTALAWLQDARENERKKSWWQMAVSNLNEVLMMQEDCE